MSSPLKNRQKFLKVKLLSKNATLPVRKSRYAAGYDLYSAYEYTIPKRGKLMCKTDIAIEIPTGYYGRVAPRSGLTLKHSIDVGAGVIDSDYRGNVGVILFNHGDEDFSVKKGDRIAQLVLTKIGMFDVLKSDELDKSDRSSGGFGSTGMK